MNSIHYQENLDQISSGAVILDSRGIVQAYNPEWLELASAIGLPKENGFVGTSYGEYGAITSLVPNIEKQISRLLNGEAQDFCVHVPCGSGSDQRVLEISAELWGENHKSVILHHRQRNFMGKSPEKWLKQDVLALFFEKLSSGLIFQSASGEVELANIAASKILGLSFDTLFDSKALCDKWAGVDGLGEILCWTEFPSFLTLASGISRQGFVLGVDKPKARTWVRVDSEILYQPKSKEILGVISTLTDISLERKIHEELNRVTDRLRLALDSAHIGIWDWDVRANKMIWDERMFALYGYPGKTHLPVREVWTRAIAPEEREKTDQILKDLRNGTAGHSAEYRVTAADGSTRYLRAQGRAIADESGNTYRVVGINWDVTQDVQNQLRLKEMAFQDDLTLLPNRVAFSFELTKLIEHSVKNNTGFVVLVMDLDNFKDINDSFGHPTGDSVLCEVVARVTPLLKKSFMFSRLSGDEFGIVITEDPDREQCLLLGEKIQGVLHEPYYLPNGPAITIKVSMGLSRYPQDAKDTIELIKTADLAMYRAKDSGRDCLSWYDKEMSIALKYKVTMENKIREALRDEEFKLYYQPIVDLHTLETVGCEALIRWIDKSGKFISPLDFISVAESCGLIYELGAWINYTALKQFKLWQVINTSLRYVSINVSPHQLQYANFAKDLMELMDKTGVNSSNVQLEITEGTFLQESLNAGSHLKELADTGFHLAIDDFGTGYSSLSYLKRFHVDVIKIDKSFIDDIEHDQADKDIVKAIVAMTSSLGFKTLVEGIERPEQAEIVKSYGCGFAQGYYYGRPLNADEFAETFMGVKEKGR